MRLSRHWHDRASLEKPGITATTRADRALALPSAGQNAWFFPENDVRGTRIDCEAAASGALQLISAFTALAILADRVLFDDRTSFDRLMEICARIEIGTNEVTVWRRSPLNPEILLWFASAVTSSRT
ncbi:MAG: hypothetical protein OXE86_12240 [Alphaproteobacteria bacterium]|nr:hypothetical protein [Alphaproteobacteria bacterium]